ncbi:uncharacterized protein CPUR_02034 [Claviceps purpurea 20.1]|uniref:HAT C-terminal dimerisation domain-containing protein n=1 Tax=Claviceps purpurea (strain 20.1) TaxID=1111077 RepID=M1WIT4_CLAP2|nr:uncharacterized protein CPUR_02034 [Claviceps purpurea 20.1]
MEVLRKFELVANNKVGYFVLDNASNNDSAIDKIGAELHWQHPLHRRIRCFGHVLHLVVRAMLSPKGPDSSNLEDVDPDDFNEWQKRGPVGKLHNLVVWIHRTNKAMHYLRDQQKNDSDKTFKGTLNVLLDNSTRWLSQYYMIERALKLKPYLEDLMIEATRGARSSVSTTCPSCLAPGNLLTAADWDILGWFNDILAEFNICLLQLEGDGQARIRKGGVEKEYGSPWRVFSAYERLVKTLKKAKAAAEASKRIGSRFYSVCINSALAKLDKYHTKLDETPILYAATVLHPAMRWSVIKKSLKKTHPEKLAKAQLLVKTLWVEQYRDFPVEWEIPTSRPTPANTGDSDTDTSYDEDIWDSEDENVVVCDEYEKWCETKPAKNTLNNNPLEFWYGNRSEYPRLARMAIDVLSIPAMSAECERTFSSAGTMVDSKRSRLEASTIAVTQTLRSWLRAGLVKDEYDGLLHKMDDDSEMAEAMSKLVIDEIAEAIDDH